MTRMKESGIDWIGQIPEEWEVRPIKNIVETPVTDGPHETPVLYETGIPFLSAEAVKDGILDFNYKRGYISLRDHERFKKKVSPKKDDIFIVKSGATTGNVGIVTTDEIFDIWSPLALIRSTKTLAIQKYIYFYLLSTLFKAQVEFNWSFGTQQNIGMGVIERIKVILPPISEQERIVEILDKKTAQLDKVKALLEEQIQKLKDYRASLIYETVTKGLDKNVPMKDSGVDWIGQIPQGWEITKHKYIMTKVKEICAHYEGQDILSLTRQGVVVRDIESGKGKMPASFDGYQFLEKGDLLFCLFDIDVTPRCVGVVENNGLTSSAYSRFRLDDKISVYYYYYLFLSMDEDKVLLHLAKNLRHSLTEDDFGIIETILPSYEEQLRIADYLGKVTKSIDEIVQLKQKQIDNINKQRQTLIYDYVTGKRRV